MTRSIAASSITAYGFWTLGAFMDYSFGISSIPFVLVGLLVAAAVFRAGRTRLAQPGPKTVSETRDRSVHNATRTAA
jgi:hypothetical protein